MYIFFYYIFVCNSFYSFVWPAKQLIGCRLNVLLVFVTFIHYILHNLTLYIDKLCSSAVLFRYLIKRYSP